MNLAEVGVEAMQFILAMIMNEERQRTGN